MSLKDNTNLDQKNQVHKDPEQRQENPHVLDTLDELQVDDEIIKINGESYRRDETGKLYRVRTRNLVTAKDGNPYPVEDMIVKSWKMDEDDQRYKIPERRRGVCANPWRVHGIRNVFIDVDGFFEIIEYKDMNFKILFCEECIMTLRQKILEYNKLFCLKSHPLKKNLDWLHHQIKEREEGDGP